VTSGVNRPQDVSRYQLVSASLNGDWKTAAAIGTAYVHDYPTYYSEYWFLGRAQSELGQKAEAIQTLTVYCRYSHDEPWSTDARNLLDKLNGATK
jgi:TolA-binding protein